jgi:hypothetical protein
VIDLQIRELPNALYGVRRVDIDPNSVYPCGRSSVNVALGVVKKCGSMSFNTEPIQREFVNGAIGFAHSDFMAVNHIIKNVGEIEHRPP